MESATATSEPATAPQEITNTSRTDSPLPVSSTPVEMSTLSSKSSSKPAVPPLPTANPAQSHSEPRLIKTNRAFSTAIGPSSDQPMPLPKDESTGPTLMITLLLTTGARHPFKIDPKYLLKRNVDVQGNDPFNLSVYKLKELILREWREEWEPKPSSPSSIRLISFGKLLDDKAPLKDSKFNHDTPNVVHMTVKPQDYVDEEDTKGGKDRLGGGSEARQRSPRCRCVIM